MGFDGVDAKEGVLGLQSCLQSGKDAQPLTALTISILSGAKSP
jgi:hypothetical protein